MNARIRILLLADSHLGFDLPVRPRAGRRRRGHDFFANYRAALAPALAGSVDMVVHAGDVFDRPGVDASVAYQAYEPLVRIAERGIPVIVVPGNHERSRLPHQRLLNHPAVHIFERARTVVIGVAGVRMALTGIPFERRDVRTRFPEVLEQSGWSHECADVRLLCLHQCIEGATVGPSDFMFRSAADVIRHCDIPPDFSTVLSGHIHRQQVLTEDLRGRPLASPVLYPGSIERTSFAEAEEPKGFMLVEVETAPGGCRVTWQTHPLPARPMLQHTIDGHGLDGAALEAAVRGLVETAPADAVLAFRITGDVAEGALRSLSAARLRAWVPPTMNVEIRIDALRQWRHPARRRARREPGAAPAADLNLQLDF